MVVFHPPVLISPVGLDHAFPCWWAYDLCWAVSSRFKVGCGSFRFDEFAVSMGEVSGIA